MQWQYRTGSRVITLFLYLFKGVQEEGEIRGIVIFLVI